MCNQAVCLIAAELERRGISTVALVLLRLVAEAYAHHIRVRELIEDLHIRLRERITSNYAESLGIQPPNIEID